MRIKAILAALLISIGITAANTVYTRSNTITSTVTVSNAYDYTITASTPFSGSGKVNITNTDKAVVIFKNIKPSVVISSWLSYIYINGEAAVNGTNCQVKMYNRGTIVLPYTESTADVLTCYTGTSYSGTSCTDYSTGSSGGYMKTLSSSQLLNNIKSFKLKRGYMVTFATGTSGYGYSRCFIADKEDLEMDLPSVLAGKVSSYRLFEWFNFGKSGIANNTDATVCDVLNVQSCYTYSLGADLRPDVECIPHKIHKNWPGIADCGKVEYSAHLKTDNEPANSSDDTPATVAEVLAYWENAMRTGMRLCSPSSYDGGYTWQTEFMNAIDARGWRCDILDMHCYWVTSSFSSLSSYYSKFGRPIWVTEWLWGASWNSNGAFASGVSDSDVISNTESILSTMNNAAYVERYHYWNSESKAKIYDGGITSLGEAYAETDGGLGYNSSYEFVPVVVINKPYSLSGYVSGSNTINLSWKDKNGDMVDEIQIQYKSASASTWNTLATVTRKDKTSSSDQMYSYSGTLDNADSYCWRIVDTFDGTSYASDVLMFSTELADDSNVLPANLSDYYFQFYSKEASTDLVWAVYDDTSDEDRVYYKTANTNYGSDLYQIWSLETNSNGGYSLRNLGESGYLIGSANSWNFVTRNSNYTVESANTAFGLDYYTDSSYDGGGYWVMSNLAHGTYVGLWDNDKNFSAGEVLAGNRTNAQGTSDSGDKLGIRLIPRSVVNDALGLVTINSGSYYLYNDESGLFISAGGSWGTHAIADETGIDLTITSGSTGYTLDTNISNGGTAHYLGSNIYADSAPYEWTFAEAGTINGKQAYTISNGTAYLTSPTTANTNLETASSVTAYAKWLLYTRDDLLAMLDEATADNPVNATFLLPCAGFGRNDVRINYWNGSPARGGYAQSDWSDLNGEKFSTTFDVYQDITNVPNGIYKITLQGFYRDGGYESAATLRSNGEEALNAYFYANDSIITLPSIFSEAGNYGTQGVSTTFGYVPNSQTDASYYIYNGLYNVGPLYVTVDNESLTMGIKKTEEVGNDWTLFDNIKILYLGPAHAYGDINGDDRVSLADMSALVEVLLGNDNAQPYLYDHTASDVNKDGYINMTDIQALLELLLTGN